jgi:hypothetical protein
MIEMAENVNGGIKPIQLAIFVKIFKINAIHQNHIVLLLRLHQNYAAKNILFKYRNAGLSGILSVRYRTGKN